MLNIYGFLLALLLAPGDYNVYCLACSKQEIAGVIYEITEEDLAQVTAGMQTATGAASDLICPTCSISLFYVTKLETPSGPQSLYRCFGCGLMYVSKK